MIEEIWNDIKYEINFIFVLSIIIFGCFTFINSQDSFQRIEFLESIIKDLEWQIRFGKC